MNVETLFQYLEQEPKYARLKIKGSVDVIQNGKSYPRVSITLYNEKDSKIWINGNVSILNVLRGLATQEKLQAYEKINKTYIDENYEYVNQLLGVNFIQFQSLQNMLMGRVFTPIQFKNSQLEIEGDLLHLSDIEPLTVLYKGEEYHYRQDLYFDAAFNLNKVIVKDLDHQKELTIEYFNRQNFNDLSLPTQVKIFLKDTKNVDITLNYSSFEDSSMDTPYTVPEGYKVRTLK